MDSLLLLNGSPRGLRANSLKMLSRVGEGWRAAAAAGEGEDARGTARAGVAGASTAGAADRAGTDAPASVEVLHLAQPADFERAVDAFVRAETVVVAMPLYTDAMPALVKTYIEKLAPNVGRSGNPRLGFLVQSGFSEALHSRPLERYLEKLAHRLGCPYAGTIVRGGGEVLQMMPDEANRRLWDDLRGLGASLAREGRFDPGLLGKVARTERYSAVAAAALKLGLGLRPAQFYWNGRLKKNGAWKRRFAAPYAEGRR